MKIHQKSITVFTTVFTLVFISVFMCWGAIYFHAASLGAVRDDNCMSVEAKDDDCDGSGCESACECVNAHCDVDACRADDDCLSTKTCSFACACGDNACAMACAAAHPSAVTQQLLGCWADNCMSVEAKDDDCHFCSSDLAQKVQS